METSETITIHLIRGVYTKTQIHGGSIRTSNIHGYFSLK